MKFYVRNSKQFHKNRRAVGRRLDERIRIFKTYIQSLYEHPCISIFSQGSSFISKGLRLCVCGQCRMMTRVYRAPKMRRSSCRSLIVMLLFFFRWMKRWKNIHSIPARTSLHIHFLSRLMPSYPKGFAYAFVRNVA